MSDKVRIYSDATGLWWRPGGKGYTYFRADAGVYERANAQTHISDDPHRKERLIDEDDPWDPSSESRKETELRALRAEVSTLQATRLGRVPTVGEVEAHAAAQPDGAGWWLVSSDVKRHPDDEPIYFEVTCLEADDGAVFIDGIAATDVQPITDAIPLNANRQPCGVGG